MPSPTATALVGLSHRGSRVSPHAAAAMRQPYGGPMGVFAVVEHNGDSDEIHYVYKDNLGSWTTITDAGGVVEREQSFDAWGNLRNPETWSGDYNNTLMFDRGYTGHEHLYSFGLINMNGRMYDPVMSSFLSPDNYIQAPDFSQNFNRYAYCLNNPLRYTDPSGESIVLAAVVGAFWGAMINLAVNFNNIKTDMDMINVATLGALGGAVGGVAGFGVSSAVAGWLGTTGAIPGFLTSASGSFAGGFAGTSVTSWCTGATFGDGLAYFGIGAAAGALSAGVGAGVSSVIGGGAFSAGFLGTTAAKTAVTSFASGAVIGGSSGLTGGFITGAGNSWMQGANFGEGLLAGAIAGGQGALSGAIGGGLAGGVDAVLHGRKFWSGDVVTTVNRKYPTGPDYMQPDGSKDCCPTTGKTIDNYHGGKASARTIRDKCWIKGSDPMTVGVVDHEFWPEFANFEGMTCTEKSTISLSEIYDAFANGADVPITLNQGVGNEYHQLLLKKMEFRNHVKWFSGETIPSYRGWIQDPATGYMSGQAFDFSNALRAFILKY